MLTLYTYISDEGYFGKGTFLERRILEKSRFSKGTFWERTFREGTFQERDYLELMNILEKGFSEAERSDENVYDFKYE